MYTAIRKAKKIGDEIKEIENMNDTKFGGEVEIPITTSDGMEERLPELQTRREKLIHVHKQNAMALFYGTCLGPLWFRVVPRLIALFQGVAYEEVDQRFMFL